MFSSLLAPVQALLRPVIRWLSPSDAGWRGATRGVLIWAAILLGTLGFFQVVPNFWIGKLLGFLMILAVVLLAALAIHLHVWLLALLRGSFRFSALVALLAGVFYGLLIWGPPQGLVPSVLLVTSFALVSGALAAMKKSGFGPVRSVPTIVALVAGMVGLGGFLWLAWQPVEDQNPWIAGIEHEDRTLALPDPGLPGSFAIDTFTYGSGSDIQRTDYGQDIRYKTASVDGSRLVDRWEGPVGWARTRYWGFDHTALPVNGRVWMPKGEGPFPLVLVVHGNHSMEDYSDPGYDYLGELFASRGIITVSVDENFLNSSNADFVNPIEPGIGAENDARGWMLLKHLEQWRAWNKDTTHDLHNKFDMENIALIGHSRGGEAVAVAAAFNDLAVYPDDANETFDFGFNLRGIIAIAPADGQYNPRSVKKPLKDINYLTIHGSMDGDVQSFMGASQMSRVTFSGEHEAFRASLYIAGANHGQFNSSWGRQDFGMPFHVLFNEKDIMPGNDQKQIAKVWFSAFLETVFNEERPYLDLMGDPRKGAAWLPKAYMLANLVKSEAAILANHDEDMDLTTGTAAMTRVTGANLTKWREDNVSLKWNPLDTQVAVLAWDKEVEEETASWGLAWVAGSLPLGDQSTFVFSAADAGIGTEPKGWEAPDQDVKDQESDEDGGEEQGLDWTLVLRDVYDNEARVPLSHDARLYPQIKARTRKLPMLESVAESEIVWRRFEFPVAAFLEANPDLQHTALISLTFEFDRSEAGSVVVDDFGIE